MILRNTFTSVDEMLSLRALKIVFVSLVKLYAPSPFYATRVVRYYHFIFHISRKLYENEFLNKGPRK